ncbi:SPOR domain-containing protein [Massilia sp. DWR3-1-1]|uniref:SPOR domain-containing protein n=1 Tax=Massilia sp. DWR3-1-1 TaxID=2804559 RepID=UPI003CF5C707
MGLFSLFSKNKQEPAGQDSGYFSREEDPAAVRARSKRASSAGEGAAPRATRKGRTADDPVLPEKKRARRRLVGAIALALAVAVGLPMLLDAEPKPIANDIAIQIPSREKAAPLPLPAAAPAPADTLDQKEQLVEPGDVKSVDVKTVDVNQAAKAALPKSVKKTEPDVDAEQKARARADAELKAKAEARAEAKARSEAEAKARAEAEAKARIKSEAKAEADAEAKRLAKAAKQEKADKISDDNAKALAILEGKAPEKKVDGAGQKFVVQVAALASQEKVDELQEKLSAAGIRAHTHKVSTPSGERIQVRIGPFSREDADKMRARLDKVGLGGSMVRPDGK